MAKWAPSILAGDFLRLGTQVEEAERAGADRFHIDVDVMDGHFVPNLSLGIPIVEAMRRATSLPLEVHLINELKTIGTMVDALKHFAYQKGVVDMLSFIAVMIIMLGGVRAAYAVPMDDYITGYATAVLEREFHLDARAVSVENGVISLRAQEAQSSDLGELVEALSRIRGVVRVEVVEEHRETAATAFPPTTASAEPSPPAVGPKQLPTGVLPEGHLFKPLFADPRWPRFSAAYHYYIDDPDVTNIATVSFGETITLYREAIAPGHQWEFGIQAGVFSDFDLDAESSDLLNSDFFGGGVVSYRMNNWSTMARLFHQSSHVGDELLLRTRLQRVNLSYEGADLRVSYEFPFGLRLYGGGGGLFRREPSDLAPWSTQYGLELRSPWRFDFGAMRPILGVDLKNFEEHDWGTDISLRAGVQFESVQALGRNLQILLEYFDGHSPSGQFYEREIEYIGLGAQFHF